MKSSRLAPRPTTYKGISMRSRLEADVAKRLDKQAIRWKYEPGRYQDQDNTYLPDFEIQHGAAHARRAVDFRGRQRTTQRPAG